VDSSDVGSHLQTVVRSTVEETLNALLDAEADALCGAKRYERSPDRVDTRAGHYDRKLLTSSGEVNVKVPKLRTLPFETQIIDRYRRKESSVEESLVEMYLAGVSVRRVEDITEALWGARVSASTVSELNQKVYEQIEAWRNLRIEGRFAYVFLDGIWLKRSWGGEVTNVAVLVAIGVNSDGFREIIGVAEGMKESKESWLGFLRWLKDRGLKSPDLMITDRCAGLVEAIGETYPECKWQRCIFHFYRNILTKVPKRKVAGVADMLKAIHAQEDKESARAKADHVISKLRNMRLDGAADILASGVDESLTYYDFPREHRRRIRTNNPLERMNREIRRRTRVVGNFPDGKSALMLVAARLRYLASKTWGTKRYLDMGHLVKEVVAEVVP
jgi:transposase-like protein